MALFTDIEHQVAALRGLFGDEVSASELPSRMAEFGSDKLVDALRAAAALVRGAERLTIVGAGLAAQRSTRAAGQDGLAQARGHRTPAALIQQITGVAFGEAQRQVRLGLAILEAESASEAGDHGADAGDGGFWPHAPADDSADSDAGCGSPAKDDPTFGSSGSDSGSGPGPDGSECPGGTGGSGDPAHNAPPSPPCPPWHAPLSTAMMQGRISPTQQDAIQRGLGHPIDDSDDTHAAWAAAAAQLIEEAAQRTVEELRIQARAIRDQLDPEGAERRYAERYERRSFRIWTDADGIERGRIDFEDDGAAWIRAIRDAALRPRRGGPRFVDSAEAARAKELTSDARTNDQLSYDLLLDVLRAGALAEAESVFGTRQAGVRIVQVVDPSGTAVSTRTEDYGFSMPVSAAEQRACETGSVTVTVDPFGNPLNLGRESRVFTPRQRVALSVRDGGCRWRGCDRPASYCEAHHIDEWHADHGRTDVDRGILLCRHHHMQLHHSSWHITRDGKDDFVLHPPGGGPPTLLRPRAALVAAWAGIDPPPKRFGPQAA